MAYSAGRLVRSAPALLLGGLLALLLWGQCALNLNDNGHYRPTVTVQVLRDSLAPAAKGRPAQLYLTLGFTSHLAQACRLDTTSGNVSFKKQYWNFVATTAHGLEIPANNILQQPVALPVVIRLVPPVDSLAALRAALRTGSRPTNALRLYVKATYTTASEPDRHWPVEAATYLPAQPL
jgi:hypothetical protein